MGPTVACLAAQGPLSDATRLHARSSMLYWGPSPRAQARLERQREAVCRGLELLQAFVSEQTPPLLVRPIEPSFAVCKALASLLRRLNGGHAFGTETAGTLDAALAELDELLHRVELSPFRRRRRRHCVSAVVLPALIDAVVALLDDAPRAPPLPPAAAAEHAPAPSAMSASELEEQELVLLDLLHAPPDSYLHSLAELLVRVESLSHVLAWARFDEAADLGAATALSHESLCLVSLPRLKLTFQARTVGGAVRLYSVDHADLYISNARHETSHLLAGVPHSLLLSSSNGEMSVLVPAWPRL